MRIFGLVAGWACGAGVLADGRRQITTFYMPGDLIAAPDPARAEAVVALTVLERIELSASHDNGVRPEVLASALRCCEMIRIQRYYTHLSHLSGRSALGRMASLMVELHDRLDAASLVKAGEFELPLRHEDLADALGLSTLHVTRCLSALREQKLMTLRFRRVEGFDRARLEALINS